MKRIALLLALGALLSAATAAARQDGADSSDAEAVTAGGFAYACPAEGLYVYLDGKTRDTATLRIVAAEPAVQPAGLPFTVLATDKLLAAEVGKRVAP